MIKNYVNYFPPFYFEKAKSAGDMPTMHYHDKYEIFYLAKGSKKHFIDDVFCELEEGDFAVIPRLVPHKTGSPKNAYRYLVYFDESFLDKWFTPLAKKNLLLFFDKRFIRPPKDAKAQITETFITLENAYNEKDEVKQFLALLDLFKILNLSPKATTDNQHSLLQNIMDFAHKNYASINSLDDVADALFVSKYHICHLFAKYVEFPFNVYLTQIRLKHATVLLLTTKITISEIAEKCGFSTSTYFCSVFKKEYGVTPLAYRKRNEKK